MDARRGPVTVVGAGIAGLAAALALAKAGFEVEVFERAETPWTVGAGLQLSPNALRVIDRLGLLPRLRDSSVEATTVRLRDGRSGRVIANVPVEGLDGTPYLSLHRADLQNVLLVAARSAPSIALRFGMRLVSCGRTPAAAHLTFENAADGGILTRTAPIVVGADGVRSSLARLLGLPDPASSGATAWRTRAIHDASPDPTIGIQAWLGARRHAVAYPVRGGRETNLVLVAPDGDATLRPADAARPSLARSFEGWDPALLRLLASAEPATAWPLLSVREDRSWIHDGCICLVGDAAHAMLPYAAQGAAMAIEDAWVLACCLASSPSTEAALVRYVEARRNRIKHVAARVRFHRRVYHLPFPLNLARDAALALRSPRSLRADLAWLYDWQPPAFRAPATTGGHGKTDPRD